MRMVRFDLFMSDRERRLLRLLSTELEWPQANLMRIALQMLVNRVLPYIRIDDLSGLYDLLRYYDLEGQAIEGLVKEVTEWIAER